MILIALSLDIFLYILVLSKETILGVGGSIMCCNFDFRSSLFLRWYGVLPSVGWIMCVSFLERPEVMEVRPATMGLSGPSFLCIFLWPLMHAAKLDVRHISW
jgi:hypothetical protein